MKKTIYLIVILISFTNLASLRADAQTPCFNDSTDNFCKCQGPSNSSNTNIRGKYHFYKPPDTPGGPDFIGYDSQSTCSANLREFTCNTAMRKWNSCMPDKVYNAGFPGTAIEKQTYCSSYSLNMNSSNVDSFKNEEAFESLFSNLLGTDWDTNWNTSKSRLYGTWQCTNTGALNPPSTAPGPTRCGLPAYDVFTGGLGTSTCTGASICERDNVIVRGERGDAGKNFFCINDRIVKCEGSVTTYSVAKTPGSACEDFNPLTASGINLTPAYTNIKTTDSTPLSPGNIIKQISNFLYFFAIFYFILLMLTNAFAYVRSGEDPSKLKEIKASLFNTIAGFLFVLLSGGLIISLINQL